MSKKSKKIKWEKLRGHGSFRYTFSQDINETYLIEKRFTNGWCCLKLVNESGEHPTHYVPIPNCCASTVTELKKLVQQYEDENHLIKEV